MRKGFRFLSLSKYGLIQTVFFSKNILRVPLVAGLAQIPPGRGLLCPLHPVASHRAPPLGNAKHLSLEKTNTGLHFLHYQWREEDRTDADLVVIFSFKLGRSKGRNWGVQLVWGAGVALAGSRWNGTKWKKQEIWRGKKRANEIPGSTFIFWKIKYDFGLLLHSSE